jgi:hypothetical protein
MTASHIQRLVQRIRKRSDCKTTVKVRMLLSTFGYSRRTPETVRQVREQLAALGIAVDLSVSSPASLDERIALVLTSGSTSGSLLAAKEASEESSARETRKFCGSSVNLLSTGS